MSLQSRFIVLCGLAVLFAAGIGFVAFRLAGSQRTLDDLVDARSQALAATRGLRDLSDDLTRLARSYVGTGERRYRLLHDDALAVLEGRSAPPANASGRFYWDYNVAPDPTLLPRAGAPSDRVATAVAFGATDAELTLLRTAEQQARTVAGIERDAFAAFDGIYPGPSGEPPRVGVPDPEQAQRKLHNSEYNEAKQSLAATLDRLDGLLPARLDTAVREEQARATRLAYWLAGLAGALGLGLAAGFAAIHAQLTSPLARLADLSQSIARGNVALRAPSETGGEVGVLARSLNQLLERIHSDVTEIKLQSTEIQRLKSAVAAAQATVDRAAGASRQMEHELQGATEFKSRLLGLASHSLKAPLAEIETLSELVSGEIRDRPQPAGQVDRIRQAARAMHSLVVDILDLAARDMGQITLDRSPVNAVTLLRDVLDQLIPQARQKQQSVSHFHEGDCLVAADARRLHQVFDQLIGNAIKFSPRGKPIAVVLEGNDERIRFSVCDEGPGLTEDDRERVFGYFQRLSARPTAGEPSTGIGLALCKQLIELHGGTIGVESAGPGTGATFWIEIPKAPAPLN